MRTYSIYSTPDDIPSILLSLARRGWTINELAQTSGVAITTLYKWLNGKGSISEQDRSLVLAVLDNWQGVL